jgi:hypothetical protein
MADLNNKVTEYNSKLKEAGAPTTATGGLTYNQKFASSLQDGGVGSDIAGFSNIANMTQEEMGAALDKMGTAYKNGIVTKYGTGSHNEQDTLVAEIYQMALNNTPGSSGASAAGSTTGSAAKTTAATPGSAAQTKTVSTEYDTQGKAIESLTDRTIKNYQKQSGAFKAYIDDVTKCRDTNYPILEKMDLTHWATSEEIAKVSSQAQLNFMAACVNFGGTNPIIQNKIIMSKTGPDWTPPAFTAVAAPTLKSADFTAIGAAVQKIVTAGMGVGTSQSTGKGDTTINNTVVVQGTNASAKDIEKAAETGTRSALASANGVGGGN